MNRLQTLDSPEQFCVTLNRTEQIDPQRVVGRWTYDHPVFTREGVAAQARHGEISGVRPHALLRRVLGLGLPRGRRAAAPCGRASPSAAGRSRERELRLPRQRPPPALRAGRARVPLPDVLPLPRPGRAAAGPGRDAPVVGDRARRSPASGARTSSAIRPCRSPTRSATSPGARPARAPPARCGCSRACATSATRSTRSPSTSASRRTACALDAVVAEVTNTPWGERHAYAVAAERRARPDGSHAQGVPRLSR